MTQRFTGERTLMRIVVGENDRHHGRPLYEALLHLRALLPDLDAMIGGGLITLERAEVIRYRPGNAAER